MQDENIFKMSEMADTEIKDTPTLNILICYLLYKVKKPIEKEALYNIVMNTGIVSYFYYQDSLDFLIKNNLLDTKEGENGTTLFSVTPKGIACAKELKLYVPKSYRDTLVLAALRYFARLKHEQSVKVDYIPIENGCYAHILCTDNVRDLMELKLYAPDITQAEFIGNQILLDPAGFYGKVIELALSNEEEKYDLSDN